jgi:hypothetical protein
MLNYSIAELKQKNKKTIDIQQNYDPNNFKPYIASPSPYEHIGEQ